jgi:hypothetical protein
MINTAKGITKGHIHVLFVKANSAVKSVSNWILSAGTWNDSKRWVDSENWID